jgi:hypothetical protein
MEDWRRRPNQQLGETEKPVEKSAGFVALSLKASCMVLKKTRYL